MCEKDLVDQQLQKRDIECFLSAFNYNNYGATNISEISKLVYTGDDEIPSKLAERKRANPPPNDVNKDINVKDVTSEDMHNHNIKSLLAQIETKLFNSKVKLYHVFKKFDKDCDGYISHEDFGNCLEANKIFASKKEVASMMKLIDKNNQGYLSFAEFSKVFGPNMSTELVSVPLSDTYHSNLHATKDVNTENMLKQSHMSDAIKKIRQSF